MASGHLLSRPKRSQFDQDWDSSVDRMSPERAQTWSFHLNA